MAGMMAAIAAASAIPQSAFAQYSPIGPHHWRLRYHQPVPDGVFRARLAPVRAVSAYQACKSALTRYPGGACLRIRRTLPSGDFLVTVRLRNKVRRILVDGRTGLCHF